MNKKTQLAISMGLLFSSGTVLAQATDTIGIDWDGSGGFDPVGALDWSVGSSYSDDGIAAGQEFLSSGGTCPDTSCQFDIYTHAALQGYVDPGGNPKGISGLNSDFEWTFIFGGSEEVTSNATSIADSGLTVGTGADERSILNAEFTFEFDSNPQSTADGFFFEIYYDTNVNSDALSGLGYSDGQLIMSASNLKLSSGNFTAESFAFIDEDQDGTLSPGDVVITDPSAVGFPYQLLDSFGSDDWSDADVTYYSVVGEGGTTLEAEVGFADTNFFETDAFTLITDIVFSSENVDPFLETNPSKSFDTSAGGATQDDLASGDFVFGALNSDGDVINGGAVGITGGAGEDVLFQTDANQGFRVERIPEPGTLALLGLGLGFMSLARRRRSCKV